MLFCLFIRSPAGVALGGLPGSTILQHLDTILHLKFQSKFRIQRTGLAVLVVFLVGFAVYRTLYPVQIRIPRRQPARPPRKLFGKVRKGVWPSDCRNDSGAASSGDNFNAIPIANVSSVGGDVYHVSSGCARTAKTSALEKSLAHPLDNNVLVTDSTAGTAGTAAVWGTANSCSWIGNGNTNTGGTGGQHSMNVALTNGYAHQQQSRVAVQPPWDGSQCSNVNSSRGSVMDTAQLQTQLQSKGRKTTKSKQRQQQKGDNRKKPKRTTSATAHKAPTAQEVLELDLSAASAARHSSLSSGSSFDDEDVNQVLLNHDSILMTTTSINNSASPSITAALDQLSETAGAACGGSTSGAEGEGHAVSEDGWKTCTGRSRSRRGRNNNSTTVDDDVAPPALQHSAAQNASDSRSSPQSVTQPKPSSIDACTPADVEHEMKGESCEMGEMEGNKEHDGLQTNVSSEVLTDTNASVRNQTNDNQSVMTNPERFEEQQRELVEQPPPPPTMACPPPPSRPPPSRPDSAGMAEMAKLNSTGLTLPDSLKDVGRLGGRLGGPGSRLIADYDRLRKEEDIHHDSVIDCTTSESDFVIFASTRSVTTRDAKSKGTPGGHALMSVTTGTPTPCAERRTSQHDCTSSHHECHDDSTIRSLHTSMQKHSAEATADSSKCDGPVVMSMPPVEVGIDQLDERQIYVGGLPFRTEESEIRSFFEERTGGRILCCRFLRNETGVSKGVCFLTFYEVGAARKAVSFHGVHFDGRCLTVRVANQNGKIAPKNQSTSSFLHNALLTAVQSAASSMGASPNGTHSCASGPQHSCTPAHHNGPGVAGEGVRAEESLDSECAAGLPHFGQQQRKSSAGPGGRSVLSAASAATSGATPSQRPQFSTSMTMALAVRNSRFDCLRDSSTGNTQGLRSRTTSASHDAHVPCSMVTPDLQNCAAFCAAGDRLSRYNSSSYVVQESSVFNHGANAVTKSRTTSTSTQTQQGVLPTNVLPIDAAFSAAEGGAAVVAAAPTGSGSLDNPATPISTARGPTCRTPYTVRPQRHQRADSENRSENLTPVLSKPPGLAVSPTAPAGWLFSGLEDDADEDEKKAVDGKKTVEIEEQEYQSYLEWKKSHEGHNEKR